MSTDNLEKISLAIEESLKILAEEYSKKGVNAVIATRIHRRVYEVLEDEDPYREVKKQANSVALNSLSEIEKIVKEQKDTFRAAAIASIIANTFDYGVMGHEVQDTAFMEYFESQFEMNGLAIDDLDEIKELCAGDVVYLTDNCGEIVVDTIFMKEIKKMCRRLIVVVRGKPIISDATMEDALLAGVDRIADEILTNGKGAIGVIEEELPEETMERLNNSDIIIAKGMANYECLSESEYNSIAFLLTAKCEPVAGSLGVKVGDMVAMLKRL
jgi:hypothetical protein